MNRVEVTKEMREIIKLYSNELFNDMQGSPDYPFTDSLQQQEEILDYYQRGDISEKFLRFATGIELPDTPTGNRDSEAGLVGES